MKKRVSLFFPLSLIAAGVLWLLIQMNLMPATNLWALTHIWPFLLIVMGLGLILRSFWEGAGLIVSILVVVGAVLAVVFAPQLGWGGGPEEAAPIGRSAVTSQVQWKALERSKQKPAKWSRSMRSPLITPQK